MKISGTQIFWLLFSVGLAMGMLLGVPRVIQEAKQDAWISNMIAIIPTLGITYVTLKLGRDYPNQTFIEYSQIILGKWLGKLIAIPYFIMWLSLLVILLSTSSDFLHVALFHKTPLFVIIVTLAIAIVYVTRQGGVESIARCGEVFGPLILFITVMTFIFAINNLHWKLLFPIYADSGWQSILKGTITPVALPADSGYIMMMLTSFMAEPNKAYARTFWGVGVTTWFIWIATVVVIMTFGPVLSARMLYPYFDVVRYISVSEFIQNIDAFVVIIWLLSVFVKISLYLFFCSYGMAQWIGVAKYWRRVMWAVAIIMVVAAILPANPLAVESAYFKKFWIPYVAPIDMFGIPLCLWIVSIIRKRKLWPV